METSTTQVAFSAADITVSDLEIDWDEFHQEEKETPDVIRDSEKKRYTDWYNAPDVRQVHRTRGDTSRTETIPGPRQRDIMFASVKHNGDAGVEE